MPLVVKNLPANAGDMGLIPGWRRSPGEGHGNPLQYPCLGNPMDRGDWWATVHGVAKSWTRLKQLSMHRIPVDGEVAQLCPTLCDPMSGGFSRREYWSGLPFPSPELVDEMSLFFNLNLSTQG